MLPALRLLFVADLAFLFVEEGLVLLLAQALFPEARALWPAALALFVVSALVWSLTIARLRAPRLAAVSTGKAAPASGSTQARRGMRQRAAYFQAIHLPIDSLWLRVVLVAAGSAVLGFYGAQVHALPAQGVAFLLWAAALLTPLLDAWRALLYELLARRFVGRLWATRLSLRVPSVSPIELEHGYLLASYQSPLLLISLGLLGAALLLGAAVVAMSRPALLLLDGRAAEAGFAWAQSWDLCRRLLFFLPPLGIVLLSLGI